MVVHYPRTVWKNSYAEHELTGKTYNLKKRKKKEEDMKTIALYLPTKHEYGWVVKIRNTSEAPAGHGQYNSLGEYCGPHTECSYFLKQHNTQYSGHNGSKNSK